MSKRKIINDPIYGLIHFSSDLIYDLIDHPSFQRLRRISQMGLSNFVYPGATHSRFAHALGALHLMTNALDTLKNKGIDITSEEYQATCIAILLHDIGHGPFSHALEGIIVEKPHEQISIEIMEGLNSEFGGKLSLAISIFKGLHDKKFLTQLVSSQLDMDRMDYLTRDSYYSGVAEGVIGYKRIIAMLNVWNNELVIEEKGLYSIEKFLVARHIMYWQVYLHKASVCSEQMLKAYVLRLKKLLKSGQLTNNGSKLHALLTLGSPDYNSYYPLFANIDDIDIFSDLKQHVLHQDQVLDMLAQAILNRNLFKIILKEENFNEQEMSEIYKKVKSKYLLDDHLTTALIIKGEETMKAYDIENEQIKILTKQGDIRPVSEMMDIQLKSQKITKYFVCFPK